MPKNITLSYARAFFELSIEHNCLEQSINELQLFNDLVNNLDDFRKFLELPKIEKEEKKEFVKNSLVGFNDIVLGFIYSLIDNERIAYIDSINKHIKLMYNDYQGIMEFEVFSPFELTDEQVKSIKDMLSNRYNKNITLNIIIKEEHLGGIVIKYNNQVIDASISTKIMNLKDFTEAKKLR